MSRSSLASVETIPPQMQLSTVTFDAGLLAKSPFLAIMRAARAYILIYPSPSAPVVDQPLLIFRVDDRGAQSTLREILSL